MYPQPHQVQRFALPAQGIDEAKASATSQRVSTLLQVAAGVLQTMQEQNPEDAGMVHSVFAFI